MGFFSKLSGDEADERFDPLDLPNSQDLDNDYVQHSADLNELDQPNTTQLLQTRGPLAPEHNDYSIEKAIALMRQLPKGDANLIVTVVKHTLESMRVQLPDIIKDADNKEASLNNQHQTLRTEIQALQAQIEDRNQRITGLLQELKETSEVKQQLLLAESLNSKEKPKSTQAVKPSISVSNKDTKPTPATKEGGLTTPRQAPKSNSATKANFMNSTSKASQMSATPKGPDARH